MNTKMNDNQWHAYTGQLTIPFIALLLLAINANSASGQRPAQSSVTKVQQPAEVTQAANPTLNELMAEFAKIEASYLPFHIDFSELQNRKIGSFSAGSNTDESGPNPYEYRAQRGHQDPKVWMLESTVENQGVSRTERRVRNEAGIHLKETSPAAMTDSFDEDDIEFPVRPLEGIFPLTFNTTKPILLSQYFAEAPSLFGLQWHGKLALVTCTYESAKDRKVTIELWLDPEFSWHPVFMRRYQHNAREPFPDEWKVTEFRVLNEFVRVSAGDFMGPIRRPHAPKDQPIGFFRCRYQILKSAYQDRVAGRVFSTETPIGGSPIRDLEPIGGEQVVVRSYQQAEMTRPAFGIGKPTDAIATGGYGKPFASSTDFAPNALSDEITKRINALEWDLDVLRAQYGSDHLLFRKVEDQVFSLRTLLEAHVQNPITILSLRHEECTRAERRLKVLFPDLSQLIISDERTNSLMVSGDKTQIEQIKAIVVALDAQVSPANKSAAKQSLKIFHLKNSNVVDAAHVIKQLFDGPTFAIEINEQTNSFVVRCDESKLQEIETVIQRLDAKPGSMPSPFTESYSSGPVEQPTVSIAEYRRRLNALEQPVQRITEQVRAAEAKHGKDHADAVKLRAKLRALVQQTFAARQEIQRAELAEFTRRLQHMKQSIEMRERIAEKIVDRRVEELLEPESNWEQTPQSRRESIGAPSLSGGLPQESHGDWILNNSSSRGVTSTYQPS